MMTILDERRGAQRGSVTDILLPKWIADRIFPTFGTMYGAALVLALSPHVTNGSAEQETHVRRGERLHD
jgi:hypothetical protein